MSVRWSVHLDRDDDGRFDGPQEDISAAVLAIRWRRGMAQAQDSVARPGEAVITLRNRDRRFSPELQALAPGRLLQVRSHEGAQERVHFTGHVDSVEPEAGALGSRRAVLLARDAGAQLAGHRIRLPPLSRLRADEIIARCLDAVPLRRQRLRGLWLLGQAGQGELGRNTRLVGINIRRQLQPDPELFPLAGDTWSAGIPALTAIGEICAAARGRFFIDHLGHARYLNRHSLLQSETRQASFRDDVQDLRYSWADARVSQVEVLLTPRRRGRPGSVVWTLEQSLAIEPQRDEAQLVVLRYRDETGRPCGALDLIAPVAGQDWRASSRADGRGRDYTQRLTLRLREAGISAALLEVRNSGHRTAWLLAGAQLRGTPLCTGDPLLVRERSLASENRHGPATLQLDLPALASLTQARALARFELARRQTPRGRVRSLTLSGGQIRRGLARRLFDRIRVAETQTGREGDYFIIGEELEILAGAGARLTWRLESATNPFWSLGRRRLGRDTLLAW